MQVLSQLLQACWYPLDAYFWLSMSLMQEPAQLLCPTLGPAVHKGPFNILSAAGTLMLSESTAALAVMRAGSQLPRRLGSSPVTLSVGPDWL